jgi:uncharacterized membrane protein
MKQVKKTIRINAPASRVYEHLTRPANLVEIWPNMVEVTNVKRAPDGANSFDWVYKMVGVRFHGHCDTVRADQNRSIELENKIGIKSHFRFTFAGRDDTTDLTLDADYEVPIPLIGKVAEKFLVKLNERDMETLLANLKERVEIPQPRVPLSQEKHV